MGNALFERGLGGSGRWERITTRGSDLRHPRESAAEKIPGRYRCRFVSQPVKTKTKRGRTVVLPEPEISEAWT